MSVVLTSRKSRVKLILWLAENAVIMLAFTAAVWLRFLDDPEAAAYFFDDAAIARALLFALVLTTAMSALGLYQVHERHNRRDLLVRLLLAFAMGGTGLLVLYYAVPATYVGRGVLLIALLLGAAGVLGLRELAQYLLHFNTFRRRVLVLGAGRNADLINRRLRRNSDRRSFVVLGFLPIVGQCVSVHRDLLIERTGSLLELAMRLNLFEIVVAPDERRGGLPMEDMLACAQHGIRMTDLSTFLEREAGTVTPDVVDPSWLVFSGGFDHSMQRRVVKRFFDLLAAATLLLLAWPVMIAVALCVRLESRGPVLFRQTRVGEGGKLFDVIKFRSMRVDAESDGVARWASRTDARNTRVGRFIRLTRLDELPQLFNILAGDMSFVGPRPERPQFVDMLSREIRYYTVRHCVKPGLTGWAQLRYPYGASVPESEEKLKFDLFYVKNHGLLLDLMILLQTVEVVLFQRGAR